ncbi:MAG: YwaF family protein [Gammaproteobacteria bacterium]|nr:YwaF family protein [Gammaproteobacteria bacterium]
MWENIGRYFGFGPSLYEAEGWFSWQHLVFVTIAIIITTLLAVLCYKKNKDKPREKQFKVLKVAAIVMITAEVVKIILHMFELHDFWAFRGVLPLYLCSILLISLPVAGFGKGRIQEAALDFTMIFGYIACIAGTYLAGNIFTSPILSFHVNVSVFTHCISGFAAIYITLTKLAKMEIKNIWIVGIILLTFELIALVVDIIQEPTDYQSNYMFLMRDSGTPFFIITNMVNGIQVLYTIVVMLLYFIYMALFIGGYHLIKKLVNLKKQKENKTA